MASTFDLRRGDAQKPEYLKVNPNAVVPTKAIAEEAGVAEALIQRYFEGKQGLLLALMKDFAEGEAESCINLPQKRRVLREKSRVS